MRYPSLFLRLLANSIESDDYFFQGSPCWEWTGYRQRRGYGRFSMRMQSCKHPVTISAHRAMAQVVLDRPLDSVMETIEHACEIPWCINPWHFKLCTRADNTADMRARVNGKPRKQFEMMLDRELWAGFDALVRMLPRLKSTVVEEPCPF